MRKIRISIATIYFSMENFAKYKIVLLIIFLNTTKLSKIINCVPKSLM